MKLPTLPKLDIASNDNAVKLGCVFFVMAFLLLFWMLADIFSGK